MKQRTGTYYLDKTLPKVLLGLAAVFFVIMALTARGDYGGADTYWHYFISHYAFQYPSLFLDHWGKPLFIALSAPFAYFGFVGLQMFNIIVSLLSAYLAWQLAKKTGMQFGFMAILLTLFAPVYFTLVFSGLTENLCGLVLIAAVYLFFDKKYAWAAIAISFIPFARTEGFIFLPLFALALAWNRKWWPISLLLTGFLFYSIIGYFHYHDFWWFFAQNPYGADSADIYGHGSIWHFTLSYRELFGYAFTALIIAGGFYFSYCFFRRPKTILPLTQVLLILMPVAAYFAAHSYVWWKGSMGSVGLLRVIGGMVPLAAVLAVKGFNVITPLLKKKKILQWFILLPLCAYIVYTPFQIYPVPIPAGPEEKVFDKVAEWMINEKVTPKKLWVFNPYLAFKLDMNPYDEKKIGFYFPSGDDLIHYTQPGDVMVWDAHFGPAEGRTPLSSLMNSKFFMLSGYFPSDDSYMTGQGTPFEIYVFSRTGDTVHAPNILILEQLKQERWVRTLVYENTFSDTQTYPDSTKTNSCFLLKKEVEFSPGMEKTLEEIKYVTNDHFEISADMWPLHVDENSYLNFVVSVSDDKDTYFYRSFPIQFNKLEKNKWNPGAFRFIMPEITDKKAVCKVYLWNDQKNEVLIDNLKLSLIREK